MEAALLQPEQVTPAWLTNVLRKHGVLPRGKVSAVHLSTNQSTFASSVNWLTVDYSQDANPAAPARLFLKLSNPTLAPGNFDPQQLSQEMVFYQTIAPAMAAGFTIPCFDVGCTPETGANHILLKDVSETHVASPNPSDDKNCELAVDALAQLHAFWWDHPLLGKDIGSYPTQQERQQEWVETEKCTTAFMAALGDQLPLPSRAIYENVLPALPGLFKRHSTGKNLTLAHGDAHLGNFLFPKNAQTENTYLIDWQFWHPTLGGTDLAFMMAAEWETETRQRLERVLLARYYHRLMALGVQNYRWEDCWNDYRLSVILVSIFIPVWRWAIFKWDIDTIALERSMTAFKDLACTDLLI